VAWEELEAGVTAGAFTLRTVPERLAALREDPWASLAAARQTITAAMRRAVGMRGWSKAAPQE
jgi:bifunctional non-homologous end joining protein LigD